MQIAAASPQLRVPRSGSAEALEKEKRDLPRADGELRQAGQRHRQDRRGQAGELLLAGRAARSAVDPRSEDDGRSDVAAARRSAHITYRFARLKVGEARLTALRSASDEWLRSRAQPPPSIIHSVPPARLQTHPPQTLRRSPDGRADLRHRSRRGDADRQGRRRDPGHGRRNGDRHRRRQHLPRRGRERARHGPRDGRLHGHAGHGHQRAGAAGRARAAGRA